ncbi:hypothetical protein ACIBCH_20590 [Amycolatopsis thailandensis]|uniref:hypothetical protein n=1 Tax=Amycolatopsis thailandensis TaxID=589330 RepID=UPI0037AD7CB6
MVRIAYATRERVKRALDSAQTARTDAQVDTAILAATDSINGRCHRTFYPEYKTVAFDWPNRVQRARSWRLRLDANEIIDVATFTSGGVDIPVHDLLLYPNSGPPFNRIEISLASSSALSAGNTYQQSAVITGLYGYANEEAAAGVLDAAVVSTTETSIAVSDSAAIGIGQLIRIGAERMVVTGKRALSTGQTVQVDLAAQDNATTVTVVDGSSFAIGEVILVGAERMLILDVAGNTLIVKRRWDGTVLAAHTTGATVYAPRTLIVERGVLGTTTAAHSTASPVVRWEPPPLIEALAVAEALVRLGCEQAGYATSTRAGESARSVTLTIDDLREQVEESRLTRKARTRAV